jgi:hypothetical protein
MARIQQINPNDYTSNPRINDEFENILRYLVAAEIGNKTLKELLSSIFASDGTVDGIIELRNDSALGIQYRVGSYDATDTTTGWQTLASLDSLRGEAGVSSGTVVLPILAARSDATGDGAETDFAYTFAAEDEVLVFLNGALQREGGSFDYTLGTNEVIFNTAPALNDDITLFKARADATTNTVRTDTVPASNQSVFAFTFPTENAYELYVYKNGVLQREGGSNDYTIQTGTNTITFTSPVTTSDTMTTLLIEATGETTLTGLMTEENYVNASTGKILYAKIEIADGDIAQAKVANLVTDLGNKAVLEYGATEPVSPSAGNLWIDSSSTPNVMKFYDGVQFIATSPESAIPSFTGTNALQYIRVNGTGTALELADIDLSGLVTTAQKGAANGVASLDANGLIPEAQMPDVRGTVNISIRESGSITNGDYPIQRFYKTKLRIVGLTGVLNTGSCQIQMKVNGSLVGTVYSLSTSALDQPFSTALEVDALSSSKPVAVTVSSASSADTLDLSLVVEILE